MIRKIFSWLKRNYFSGDFKCNYEISKIKNWEKILKSFEKANEEDNKGLFIGNGEDLISFYTESSSGLRWPSNIMFKGGEITRTETGVNIFIYVSIGNYFKYFFILWSAGILIFTLIFLFVLYIDLINKFFDKSILIGIPILLAFNAACWLRAYLFRMEAESLLNKLIKIIERD
jgi:hypothetical protein